MARTYYMRAKASDSGIAYNWAASWADFAGAGYAGAGGTGTPTNVMVESTHDDGAGGGGSSPTFGTDLTDANQTITVTSGENRRQPAASLTANRVKTLAAPASDGMTIALWRYDATGNTLTVTNGGLAGGDTLVAANTKVTFTSGGGEWAVSNTETI